MFQLRKINLADSIVIYGRGRELFRPPMYYTFLRSDIVKIVGWMLWKVKVTP